ncbi:MAG: hypothetical protein F6J92_28065 [Symploca sp. SIO1A3]|nr:hypothetical protein [Symploca sp. SIO1A3]
MIDFFLVDFTVPRNSAKRCIINSGRAIAITSLQANIETGTIDSSSAIANGGNITLKSEQGAIKSGNLNSSGAIDGGNITVEASTQINQLSIINYQLSIDNFTLTHCC